MVDASVAWLRITRLSPAATRFDALHVSALGAVRGTVVFAYPPPELPVVVRMPLHLRHVGAQLGAFGLLLLLLQCTLTFSSLVGLLQLLVDVVMIDLL